MSSFQAMKGSVNIELSNTACNIYPQKRLQLVVSNDNVVPQIKEQIQRLTKLSFSHITVTEKSRSEYFVDVIVHKTDSCEECKRVSEIFKRNSEFNKFFEEAHNSGVFDIILLNLFF